jgi:hypothetical protein
VLEWNRIALERAERAERAQHAGSAGVQPFYASLHLNLAYSLEQLGRNAEAREHYTRAQRHLERLGDAPYANLLRAGITAGHERVRRECT